MLLLGYHSWNMWISGRHLTRFPLKSYIQIWSFYTTRFNSFFFFFFSFLILWMGPSDGVSIEDPSRKWGQQAACSLCSPNRSSLHITMPFHMVLLRSGQLQFNICALVYTSFLKPSEMPPPPWCSHGAWQYYVVSTITEVDTGSVIDTYLPLDFYSSLKMKSVTYCAFHCAWHIVILNTHYS